MVSMSSPQTVQQAEDYLEKENYYQENSMLGTFQGKGLEHLGIEKGTTVDAEIYKTLLKGFHPTTGEKLVKNAGKEKHRAGFDVTFSAPKSVSVLMEYYEANGQNVKAEMIRKAHDMAVKNSMVKLENGSGKTRIGIGNNQQIKVDADIIYATFQHDTSREIEGNIDPQLHTHNFIFTPTFYTDERTGEVRSMALSNEEIFKNKMYFGQNYRSELASSLAEMGYKIEVSDRKNGFFELEGFDEKQLKTFSKRSELIEEKLPEYREKYPKMKEAQLRQLIVKDTKNAKKEIDRDVVREANLERMGVVGIDKALIDSMEDRGKKAEINEVLMTVHIEKSLENIMDRQSLFSHEELSKMVLKYGLEYGYTESDYMPFIAKHSEIVQLHNNVFSTKEMIKAEKNVILSIHQGRDKYTEFAPYESQILQSFLEEKYPTLTDEQVKMVRFILGNKDQFVAIQGDAGTGKTYAAKVVKHYLETLDEHQEIIGLSFTGKATQGLEDDTKIKSQTVHSFLLKESKLEGEIEPQNRLIIVDEAGMIGSLQMNALIENAKKNGDRMVSMGDTKQYQSISAGNIFNDMQKYGTKTVRLSQAIRFESELTKVATTSLKMEMVKKSLETIKKEGTLKELSRDKQVETIAKNYSNLKPKQQKETLIIASTNKDKEAINWAIRANLGLKGNSYKVKSHASLNGIARHYSEGYEKGLQVSIQGELEGFKRGQKLYVTGSIDDKIITVKGSGKRAIEKQINVYEHGDKLQVFREVEKPFAKGDVIVFTKNTSLDKKTRSSVKNGERTRIKSINKHGDVVTAEGKKFNINKMPYVDHGFAITDVASQGSTYKNVVVMAKAEMASFHSFYTQITRAKRGIELFTDNKELLEKNVLKESDFKTTLDYTIKKREKSSLEKEQPLEKKEKSTYKDIHTKKYVANPIDIKRSPDNTLKRVGVHQSNLDSQMKIDIYRNSIGKLDGTSQETAIPHEKYKGIKTSNLDSPAEIKRSTNLGKVGVYQSNVDTQMKIDIYRKSINKLEGVSQETTTPHKKYRGIEVAKKQQKENIDHDRTAIQPIDAKDGRVKRETGRGTSGEVTNDRQRGASDQSRNAGGVKDHDSRTRIFAKVKGTFVSLLKKDEKKEIGSTNDFKQTETRKAPHENTLGRNTKEIREKTLEKMQRNTDGKTKVKTNTTSRQLRKPSTKANTIQSNLTATKRESILRGRTSVYGLSNEPLVRSKPSPKVLLQGNVSNSMGRGGRTTNNDVRREGNVNHGTHGSQTETRSVEEKRLYERIKAFKGDAKSAPIYTPDKSKSLEERVKTFKQHKDKEVGKEKSKEIER
jgi:conjugative relaxase-like TrwC/TraI family protein